MNWNQMKAQVLHSKYADVMELPNANNGCYAVKDEDRLPEDLDEIQNNEVRKSIEFADAQRQLQRRAKR